MNKPQAVCEGIPLRVTDVSGQRSIFLPSVPKEASAGEVLKDILSKLDLPQNDSPYQLHLDREGRSLFASELVRDALQPNDLVVPLPSVTAGRE